MGKKGVYNRGVDFNSDEFEVLDQDTPDYRIEQKANCGWLVTNMINKIFALAAYKRQNPTSYIDCVETFQRFLESTVPDDKYKEQLNEVNKKFNMDFNNIPKGRQAQAQDMKVVEYADHIFSITCALAQRRDVFFSAYII